MGSLSYALGGGIAGAGQGMANVGAEAMHRITQEGLEKLRADYAQKAQERGQTFQAGEAEKQRTFQAGQTEKEITGRSAVAHFTAEQAAQRAKEHEAGATERAHILANARLGVARTNADAKGAAAKATKPWQVKNVNVTEIDPNTHIPTTTSKPLLFNPNTNALYAPVGDKLVPWDTSRNAPAVDPKALARIPVPEDHLRTLYADPNGVIPPGFKGAGLTNVEQFERTYHYLPKGISAHLTQGGMVNAQSPAATGAGAEEVEDQQDSETAEGGSDLYDNRPGGAPPQASDNEQAQ